LQGSSKTFSKRAGQFFVKLDGRRPHALGKSYICKATKTDFVNTNSASQKILYADDDYDDRTFLSETLAATATEAKLVLATNGEEAIRYLQQLQLEELPDLIILDLNMPRLDGKQTLNFIKSKPEFSEIPVVILSTSKSKLDMEVCQRLGASSYLQKPVHYDGYREILSNCLPLIRPVAE
jgi:CheY-like chemotaxis protein